MVILDKDVYGKHIESFLSDKAKFEKVDTKKGLLDFTVTLSLKIVKCLVFRIFLHLINSVLKIVFALQKNS